MKRIALLLSLAATPALADVTIMDNDQTATVDCTKHKTVNIVGNGAKVTLTGTCEKLMVAGNDASVTGSAKGAYVAGNDNTLTLDAVDSIGTPGNNNTVTYKKTVSKKKAAISNPGNGNKISQAK